MTKIHGIKILILILDKKKWGEIVSYAFLVEARNYTMYSENSPVYIVCTVI